MNPNNIKTAFMRTFTFLFIGLMFDKSLAAFNEIKQLTLTDSPQFNGYFDEDGDFFFKII